MRNIKKYRELGKFFVLLMTLSIFISDVFAAAPSGYDTTRIFKAMAKARRGENITIGVLGGSITAGSLASTENKRWANLMTDWWETTFPQSTVTLVNAGFGGTGSDIGTHRVQGDLLKYNPDFVVVEFAVNDDMSATNYNIKMLEGLIRQILVADSLPGVMILTLKQVDGTSAVASHKQVADHYGVPLINFTTMIDTAVANDGISLASIYGDGTLHPNDIGMAYIADFIKYELNNIYSILPDDTNIDTVNTTLPSPIVTDVYAHTYKYTNKTLVPATNNGWQVIGTGWIGHKPGDEITFTVDGNALSILFTQFNTAILGQAEVWVDNGTHVTLDGHFNENWGPATRFALAGEGLADGNHILHVKITGNNSSGSTGHDFQILNVQKAGNFESAAPIANAGKNVKVLTNTTVPLVGTGSDPENDTIRTFDWSIISKPIESTNVINDETNDTASFTPDAEGYYLIGFLVNDGISNSVMSTKTIHAVATNEMPVANAGNDSTVYLKKLTTINGNMSHDPDSDSLFFSWRLISQPEGSNVVIKLPNTSTPNFRPFVEGEYKIGLIVNDSIDNSIEDEIIITAVPAISSLDENIKNQSVFKLFPVPVNDLLNIEYYIDSPGWANISIYDISGQRIIFNSLGYQNSGTQNCTLQINPAIFTKGTYFIVLETQSKVYSDQFIND